MNSTNDNYNIYYPYLYTEAWVRLKQALKKANNNYNSTNLTNINTMTLQNLKTPKTTEFNSFITPVMDYINTNYSEFVPQLDPELLSEIINEIREQDNIIVFIGTNNKLYLPYHMRHVSSINTRDSRKVNLYDGNLRVVMSRKHSDDKLSLEERYRLYADWDEIWTKNENLTDAYYIKKEDMLKLVEFLNNEQDEIREERYKKEKEAAEKKAEYTKLAAKFGLSSVNTNEIDKLVKIEELQTKGLNAYTPVELRNLLAEVGFTF